MHNNILETIVETGLPYIISLLEIMGIIVVSWSGISAFWEYIKDMIVQIQQMTILNLKNY